MNIGTVDVALVLGSGLSEILAQRAAFDRVPFAELELPVAKLAGHADVQAYLAR